MPRKRTNHPPSLKAKVAVEAIRGHKTTSQIAQAFSLHPNVVAAWKKHALDHMVDIFSNSLVKQQHDIEKDELFKQIGQLKVELDFLKKRAGWLE
jgi:transposase-like protein